VNANFFITPIKPITCTLFSRPTDLSRIILGQGIYIRLGKTGKKKIKLWTEYLRTAIELAKKQVGVKPVKYVTYNQCGKKLTGDGNSFSQN